MADELMLSKLSITRMSHDLAGIIGAVSNSLELLAETDVTDAEALALAQDGAESLVARLSFFRMAYGADGSLTGVEMTRRILAAYLHSLENKSVAYDCHFDVDAEVPLFVLRLALLAAQICADSLMRGGTISVESKAGTKKLTVRGQGRKIAADATVADVLNGIDVKMSSPRQAGALMAHAVARENKWQMSYSVTDTTFVLTFFA